MFELREKITIEKKEYEILLEKEQFLEALECAGVDNWVGYSIAWDMVVKEQQEE